MGWCTHVLRSYCGPLITIAVGVGFMLVGAVPVAVTYATNSHGSATIIGEELISCTTAFTAYICHWLMYEINHLSVLDRHCWSK